MSLHYFVNVKYSKFAPTALAATADERIFKIGEYLTVRYVQEYGRLSF